MKSWVSMASDKKRKKKVAVVQTDSWKFDESVLDCCPLKMRHQDRYLPIKSVLRKEKYKGQMPFDQQKALFLDMVEIDQAKAEERNQRSTTDMAIGIVRGDGKGGKKIRLVECKFDVKNINGKLIEDLKDKNQKTRDYFSFGNPIQKLFVVLLNDSFYGQGLRFIKNNFSNSPDCEVQTVNGFFSQYFL